MVIHPGLVLSALGCSAAFDCANAKKAICVANFATVLAILVKL
jgi:hypothetical protein